VGIGAAGVIAVLFGLAAIVWPTIALTVIVLLFGVYALVDGLWAMFLGVIIRQELAIGGYGCLRD